MEDSQSLVGLPKALATPIFVCFTFVAVGLLLWHRVNTRQTAVGKLAPAALGVRALTRLIAARRVVSFRPNFATCMHRRNFAATLFTGAHDDRDIITFLFPYPSDFVVAKFAVARHAQDYSSPPAYTCSGPVTCSGMDMRVPQVRARPLGANLGLVTPAQSPPGAPPAPPPAGAPSLSRSLRQGGAFESAAVLSAPNWCILMLCR